MSKARAPRIDSKELAQRCTQCGAWPAPIRPSHKVALCEGCNDKVGQKVPG